MPPAPWRPIGSDILKLGERRKRLDSPRKTLENVSFQSPMSDNTAFASSPSSPQHVRGRRCFETRVRDLSGTNTEMLARQCCSTTKVPKVPRRRCFKHRAMIESLCQIMSLNMYGSDIGIETLLARSSLVQARYSTPMGSER